MHIAGGRLLALVRAGRPVVLNLDVSAEQPLNGHTDTVHLVGFVREGRLQITAGDAGGPDAVGGG